MSDGKKRVPKLRFPEFTEEWERRKFSDFVKNVAKKNKNNLDLVPYAVTNDRGFIAQKDAHDDFGYMSNVDRTAYNIVPPNSFAYNPARINVGSLGYYEGAENVIVSSLYEVFQTKEYIDDKFLLHWFKSEQFPKWIEKLQEGSVRLYFYFDKLIQCQMFLPSLEEQKRISAYLDSLDNLITLHQRRLKYWEKMKKGLRQNMFPKKGETCPQIRFPSFNDDWEQCKFSDFVKNVAKKNKNNLDLVPYAVTNDRGFIAQKDAHDDFGYMSNVDRTAYNIVPPNSFAYNPARINVGSLGYYEGAENVIVSSLYEVFQTKEYIDDKFLLHWFKSEQFPKWIEKLQEGSVRLYFYFDKLIQCQMLLPSLEEQRRISAYLDSLDNLITLHQRKLEHLQKLKKGLLQQMFI